MNTPQRILEMVVVTRTEDGEPHIAPMGVRHVDGNIVLMPFHPSRTLENLQRERTATINAVTDVRIIAGCLTGRRQWPVEPAERIGGFRLRAALSHTEVRLDHMDGDPQRPRFSGPPLLTRNHQPFAGFNRAQSAVLEAAILVSRLGMLEADKVEREIEYLTIAIDKTAGAEELEAWEWLMQAVNTWRAQTTDA